MNRKRFAINLIMISLIASGILSGLILFNHYKGERVKVKRLMETQAAEIDAQINQALSEVYGVQALVLGAQGKQVDLNRIGESLIHNEYKTIVKNILIAPDGVVEQVYPLQGNEQVVGMDLFAYDNATHEEAAEAKLYDHMVVTGPYALKQGGQGISGRIKVVIRDSNGIYRYWGLVSITLKFPEVMEQLPIDYLDQEGCVYQISKLNSNNEYEKILSKDFTAGKDEEVHHFEIEGMQLCMETYPKGGWITPFYVVNVITLTFFAFLLLGIVVCYFHFKQAQLRQYATLDALTGLVNRSSGEKQINQLLNSKEQGKHVMLLMDIDHFKSVNDTFGHQTGDRVIVETANIIKSIFRDSDIRCRLGGDEFVTFNPAKDSKDIINQKVETLLKTMNRKIKQDEDAVSISCSIGIALAPDDGKTFEELYQCADRALYYAKENGRNQASYYKKHGSK